MKTKFLLLLGFLVLLTSCKNDEGGTSVVAKERKDIALSRSEEQLANESMDFAFRLFQQVNSTEKQSNWMISPFSASMALGMTTNGAAGNTLEEMKATLGFSNFDLDGMNAYYRKLVTELLDLDNTTQLSIANSVWIKEGLPINEAFVKVNQEMYDAEVSNLNFSSPEAKGIINNWCAEKTNNAIKNVGTSIPDNTCLALINALYFKGTWHTQFNKSATKDEAFTNVDGKASQVKMMNRGGHYPYAYNDDFHIAELGYGNMAFSMVILLPYEGRTLEESLKNLTRENWEEWYSKKYTMKLDVKLPRFEITYEKDLIEDMKALGMKDAFDEKLADFSSMSTIDTYLNLLKQFTYIKVNEEGTEAAATTIVGNGDYAAGPNPNFHVNRPFAFMIKEKSTGTILFMGKVTKL